MVHVHGERERIATNRGPFSGSHTLSVHAQRLKSEADARLLRNRLERLKQEELKALKKIAETRRRAEEIMELKLRNESRMMEKRGHLVEQQRQMEEARHRAYLQKVSRHGATEQSRSKVFQSKRDMADQTRQERSDLECRAAHLRDRDSRRAKHILSLIHI